VTAEILAALMTPAGQADPYPLYAQAHQAGPVSAVGGGWFLVSGYAAVSQVLRDPGFGLPDPGSDNSLLSRSILRANPPDHPRMRSLMSAVFTPRRVAALRPAIENAVDTLLSRLPADFMAEFAFRLPVTVICELLGVPVADQDRFRPLAADLTQALEATTTASGPSPAATAAAAELGGYFTALIAERRTAPRDDLISALVAARDRLSDEELLANLIVLLVAGFETTTSLLGNGLALLFKNPGIITALRAGTLPVDGFLLIGAANRDPARYPDPDRFDPARTGSKPLSFGAGPHICIGNALARLEASVAFPRLLTLGPAPGQPPVRRGRLILRGYESLPVTVLTSPLGQP
jgi:cytochrome P450